MIEALRAIIRRMQSRRLRYNREMSIPLGYLKLAYEADGTPAPTVVATPPGGGSDNFRKALAEIEARVAIDMFNMAAKADELRELRRRTFDQIARHEGELPKVVADLERMSSGTDAAIKIRRRARDETAREAWALPDDVASRSKEDVRYFQETVGRIVAHLDLAISATQRLGDAGRNLIREAIIPAADRLLVGGFKLGLVASIVCGITYIADQQTVAQLSSMVAAIGGVFIVLGTLGGQYDRQT